MTAGPPRTGLEEEKEACARERLAALEEWKCDDRPYVQENGRTKQWATNDGQSKKARGVSRTMQVRPDLVEAATKRRPVQRGGWTGRNSDGRSNRRVGEGLAVQAMCLGGRSRGERVLGRRPAAVGGSGAGVVDGRKNGGSQGSWVGPDLHATDGTEARTVGQQRRKRRAASLREMQNCARAESSSPPSAASGVWLPCLRLCCVGLGEQGLWEALLWSRGGRDRLMCWRC